MGQRLPSSHGGRRFAAASSRHSCDEKGTLKIGKNDGAIIFFKFHSSLLTFRRALVELRDRTFFFQSESEDKKGSANARKRRMSLCKKIRMIQQFEIMSSIFLYRSTPFEK
jgi:hypothetical protein